MKSHYLNPRYSRTYCIEVKLPEFLNPHHQISDFWSFLNGLVHDYHHYFPLKNHYVTVTHSSTFRNELATTNDKAGFLTVHGVFQTLKSFFLQNYLSKTDEQISSLELPVTMILTICTSKNVSKFVFYPIIVLC